VSTCHRRHLATPSPPGALFLNWPSCTVDVSASGAVLLRWVFRFCRLLRVVVVVCVVVVVKSFFYIFVAVVFILVGDFINSVLVVVVVYDICLDFFCCSCFNCCQCIRHRFIEVFSYVICFRHCRSGCLIFCQCIRLALSRLWASSTFVLATLSSF
jgi:hypothetical protein